MKAKEVKLAEPAVYVTPLTDSAKKLDEQKIDKPTLHDLATEIDLKNYTGIEKTVDDFGRVDFLVTLPDGTWIHIFTEGNHNPDAFKRALDGVIEESGA